MDQSLEQWRPVVGYEGYYEVSDHGRVRSVDRVTPHRLYGQMARKGKLMKLHVARTGYVRVALWNTVSYRMLSVHGLVAAAFLPSRPDWATQINHVDKDKQNNHASNLEWSENFHNMRHARATHWYKGKLCSCSELAEIAGIKKSTMVARLSKWKWSPEKAVSTPVRRAA